MLFSAVSRKFIAVTCDIPKLLAVYRRPATPDVYMRSKEQVKNTPIHQILMRKWHSHSFSFLSILKLRDKWLETFKALQDFKKCELSDCGKANTLRKSLIKGQVEGVEKSHENWAGPNFGHFPWSWRRFSHLITQDPPSRSWKLLPGLMGPKTGSAWSWQWCLGSTQVLLQVTPKGYSINGQGLCKERCCCHHCFMLGIVATIADHLECVVHSRGGGK